MISTRTRKIAIIAMLAAIAYVITVFLRVPVLTVPPFLKYDPKDVIIVIGGLLYGPIAAAAMAMIVSFIEMLTVSDTGFYGLVMNVVQSCAFACTAAVTYKANRNITGAITGLVAGWMISTAVMVLWNYIITPIYIGMPRDAVAAMLLTVFLPFNLLKGGLNAALAILLYKPVKAALTTAKLLPPSPDQEKRKVNIGVMLTALFVVITGILIIMAYREII